MYAAWKDLTVSHDSSVVKILILQFFSSSIHKFLLQLYASTNVTNQLLFGLYSSLMGVKILLTLSTA
jgi:hypothetical protein